MCAGRLGKGTDVASRPGALQPRRLRDAPEDSVRRRRQTADTANHTRPQKKLVADRNRCVKICNVDLIRLHLGSDDCLRLQGLRQLHVVDPLGRLVV